MTELVISGTRPPSAMGCGRPLSTNSFVFRDQKMTSRQHSADDDIVTDSYREAGGWQQQQLDSYDSSEYSARISERQKSKAAIKAKPRQNSKMHAQERYSRRDSFPMDSSRPASVEPKSTRINKSAAVDDNMYRSNKFDKVSWEAPWNNNVKPTYVFDATDYKAVAERKAREQQKSSSQHGHASTVTKHLTKMRAPSFKPSYVDEILFGSHPVEEPLFPPPWDDGKNTAPLPFDGFEHKATVHHDVSTVKPKMLSSIVRPLPEPSSSKHWKFAFHK